MPGRSPTGMMASMSAAGDVDRTIASSQPDLFDESGVVDAGFVAATCELDEPFVAAGLTDGALIVLLPEATMSAVEAIRSEVATRRLESAVPALEHLWRRFTGFGVKSPLVEQRAVLAKLARVEGASARAALREIVLSKGLPASLRTAAEAALSLPARFIGPLLEHKDAAVRVRVFALAHRAGVPVKLLCGGFRQPSAAVRRLGAVALGNGGDAETMVSLVAQLARDPSKEVIEALACDRRR